MSRKQKEIVWTAEKVRQIQRIAYELDVLSLDTLVYAKNDNADSDGVSLLDFQTNCTITIDDEIDNKILRDSLLKVVNTLKPREAQVIRLRFGLSDMMPKTLDEIGNMYGVTRERIRQVEACALRHLKGKLIGKGITNINDLL